MPNVLANFFAGKEESFGLLSVKELAERNIRDQIRKWKIYEAKLKDFCRQTGQDHDRFREQVLGFNRSPAQKAVHAAKKNRLTSGGKDGIIREQEFF